MAGDGNVVPALAAGAVRPSVAVANTSVGKAGFSTLLPLMVVPTSRTGRGAALVMRHSDRPRGCHVPSPAVGVWGNRPLSACGLCGSGGYEAASALALG